MWFFIQNSVRRGWERGCTVSSPLDKSDMPSAPSLIRSMNRVSFSISLKINTSILWIITRYNTLHNTSHRMQHPTRTCIHLRHKNNIHRPTCLAHSEQLLAFLPVQEIYDSPHQPQGHGHTPPTPFDHLEGPSASCCRRLASSRASMHRHASQTAIQNETFI